LSELRQDKFLQKNFNKSEQKTQMKLSTTLSSTDRDAETSNFSGALSAI